MVASARAGRRRGPTPASRAAEAAELRAAALDQVARGDGDDGNAEAGVPEAADEDSVSSVLADADADADAMVPAEVAEEAQQVMEVLRANGKETEIEDLAPDAELDQAQAQGAQEQEQDAGTKNSLLFLHKKC